MQAHDIFTRARTRPHPRATLLAARIQVARGDYEAAAELAAFADAHCAPESFTASDTVQRRMIDLACRHDGDLAAWTALFDEAAAADLQPDEQIEILLCAARLGIDEAAPELSREAIARAEAMVDRAPGWRDRIAALAAALPVGE